ncbi:MAG TPA: hypothetical protein PKD61_29335, partial [Polyangiaceae bacterium]|nr:hypothetical protein [Polyangiaceae bacterium]
KLFGRTVPLKDSCAKVLARATNTTEKPATATKSAALAKQKEPMRAEAAALVKAHGISSEDARVLGDDADLLQFFELARAHHGQPSSVASWLVNELPGAHRGAAVHALPFGPAEFAELVALVDGGTITGAAGKEVLRAMLGSEGNPKQIVEARGLTQIADGAELLPVIERVLEANAETVARYRGGNANLLGAFVGMVMRETRGKANPKLVNQLLLEKLG